MSIPVGTKVRLLRNMAHHEAGTETVVVAGPADTARGYRNPIGLIGRGFGDHFDYAIELEGYAEIPLLVRENELEVLE